MESIKAVSPTVSGIDKSGESYRKWKQSEAVLWRSLKYILKKINDRILDESSIALLNLRISDRDDISTRNYKKMAAKQLDWCQHNQEAIIKKANKLYALVQSENVSGFLKRRCCDFKKLEAVHQKWMERKL